MALSKDDILNAIAEMSVMDIVSLIEAMEEKVGVTAAVAVAAAPAAAGGDAGTFVHRLSAAVGPACVLGHHHRREHRAVPARSHRCDWHRPFHISVKIEGDTDS